MQQSLVSRWYEMLSLLFVDGWERSWERRSKGTTPQSDENASSLPSFWWGFVKCEPKSSQLKQPKT